MQRIEEKRIDNSSLVPSRIAEQKTTWRQPNNLGLNLSGFDRAINSLGRLADSVSREFEKADREMDELAQIKANALFAAEQQAAFNKLEGMPLTEIGNNLDKIRGDFAANVRKKLEAIPMTDRMREVVNANLLGADEIMKVKLESQLKRKQANYIIGEHSDILKNALESGDTAVAIAENKKLAELGVKTKYTEADIKSNGVFVNLRQAFDLNDFEYLDKLSANKDGKYTHFKELKQDDRMKLIEYGRQKQNQIQDKNYRDYLVKNAENQNFSIAELKEQFQNGKISQSGYVSLVKGKQEQNYADIVFDLSDVDSNDKFFDENISNYSNLIEQEFKEGNISEKRYKELNAALTSAVKKEAIERLKSELKNTQARNEYAVKALKADIMSIPMPHAKQRQNVYNAFAKRIQETIPDLEEQQKMLNLLDNELNDDPLNKSENGGIVKSYINDLFARMVEKDKKGKDNVRINDYKLDALFIARQMISKGANYNDIKTAIDNSLKKAIEKDIPRLINSSMRAINPATYGKIYNEKLTKHFANWHAAVASFHDDYSAEVLKIPEDYIKNKDIIKTWKGKDYYGNNVTYAEVKQEDGTTKQIILEDYQEIITDEKGNKK